MADTVSSIVVTDSPRQYVIALTCISDGTGETNVVKVDKSAINPSTAGIEPVALDLQSARWTIQGFTSVQIKWDHTADVIAALLSGGGYDDYTQPGPQLQDLMNLGGRADSGTGQTGDILLTSVGASATATYDITLVFRKRA